MDDETLLSSLLSSAVLVFVGTIMNSSSRLFERIIIGRSLDPSAYGDISIGLAIMGLGVTLSLFGTWEGIPRFMSRFDNDTQKRGAWVSGVLISAVMSIFITAGLFLNRKRVVSLLFESNVSEQLIGLFILAIPLIVGLRLLISGVRGFENTRYKTYAQDLIYPIIRILLLVLFLNLGVGIVAAGYAYVIAGVISIILAYHLLNRLFPIIGSIDICVRELFIFSAPLFMSTFLSTLLIKADNIMLGLFRDSYEVGLYGAAFPLANGLVVVLGAFGFLYLPLASRLDANNERDQINRIYKITTRWIFLVTLPIFSIFVVFSDDIIKLFFSAKYTEGAIALVILSVGFFSDAISGRNRATLTSFGYTGYLLIVNSITFTLNILLNLFLIPKHGIVGASVASASSFIFLNLMVSGILWKKFGISLVSQENLRTFTLVPIGLFPVAFLFSQSVTLSFLNLPVILIVLGLIVIFLTFIVGGFNSADNAIIEFGEDTIGVDLSVIKSYIED